MFDGADLNAAYGTSLSPEPEGNQFLLAAPGNGLGQLPPPPQSTVMHEPPATAPAATSHAMPPEVPYTPPSAMYVHHPAPQRHGYMAGGAGADSMWDKLSSKKYDVLKLVILSLVILLAMSSDRVVNFYLMKYINGGIFTTVQEFLIRLSYPLGVLVILWLIKASSS